MTAAFVYDAIRTPFGRFGGGLAKIRPDDLGATVMKAALERSPDLDPERIDEIVFGNANGAGEDNRNVGRMAGLLAGLPVSVPGTTVFGVTVPREATLVTDEATIWVAPENSVAWPETSTESPTVG